MKLIHFKNPNLRIENIKRQSPDYFKWTLDFDLLLRFRKQLNEVIDKFVVYEKDFYQLPIKIRFNRLLPKSDRIKHIFKNNKKEPMQIGSNYIFENGKLEDQIDIVYSCSKVDVEDTKNKLEDLIKYWPSELVGLIKKLKKDYLLSKINKKNMNAKINNYIKTNKLHWFEKSYNDFYKIAFIEFSNQNLFQEGQIITFFELDTFVNLIEKLKTKGIEIDDSLIALDKFINLDKITINKIIQIFPFLISSASRNLMIEISEGDNKMNDSISIEPNLETNGTIGVIDTYGSFSKGWENYVDYIEEPLPQIEGNMFQKDYSHGTSVSTLIVGHDIINPRYKDDLGIFKVKLFGVLPLGKINIFYFMKKLEKIIKDFSSEIKIWNLSIDSINEVNGISLLGQFFDILQSKHNVLFVISAGNIKGAIAGGADSLSAITVGSLYETNTGKLEIASYSGSKNIFGRFQKPNTYEISNDLEAQNSSNNFQYTIDSHGYLVWDTGTSFSAPLTARKCCYLMNKYNLSLESVKAIINLLSEISTYKLPNIHFDNNLDKVLLICEGKIKPKEDNIIEIKLPTFINDVDNTKKIRQDFTYALGLSYFVIPSNKLGDEYSSVDITFKIVHQKKDGGKEDIFKSKTTSKTNGKNAFEVELIRHFKKYDPNKVLINKDFINPHGYVSHSDKFYLRVTCNDLFNRNDKEIRYGCAILLKEKNLGSLNNFELLNEKNILQEGVHEILYENL